jgi:2-oxoglutarate dehydrogenase E1 component
VQEEPRNMGAWHFVQDQLRPMAVRYIGRVESASPATGSLKRHQQEQAEIIEAALAPEIRANRRPSRRRK